MRELIHDRKVMEFYGNEKSWSMIFPLAVMFAMVLLAIVIGPPQAVFFVIAIFAGTLIFSWRHWHRLQTGRFGETLEEKQAFERWYEQGGKDRLRNANILR